jgi:hypothetical protein
MATCVTLDTAVNITPDCAALLKEGGTKKVWYVGSLADVATYTQGTNGELTALTLATGKKLLRLEGKKEKNNADFSTERSENGPLYTHNANFIAYYSTQLEKATIEAIARMDDLFVFVPTSANQVEVYGMFGANGLADGLSMNPAGGTGTVKGDSTVTTLAFTGQTSRMAPYVQLGVGGDFDATITALEALTVAQA